MKTGKPLLIAGVPIAGFALHSYGVASAWTPPHAPSRAASRRHRRRPSSAGASSSAHSSRSRTAPAATATALPATPAVDVDLESLHLTPELEMMTNAFGSIPDEKTRHKQLLYMASKLPPVDNDVRIPANKVPGCLSTVHVDCSVESSEKDEGKIVVNYVGDSDGLLTKGLLALLIRGLSGCTPEQIIAVDPKFIQAAKISQTLTPGRNNGFLNMLAVMKRKAAEATAGEAEDDDNNAHGAAESNDVANEGGSGASPEGGEGIVTSFDPIEGKPMYNAILSTLIRILKPTAIRLTDNSSQYAGGAAGNDASVESHFELEIVAEVFDELDVAKRHQLIHMLLGEVIPKISVLEINARSTSEE